MRSPQKLEKWLHILQADPALEEILSLLAVEFPQVYPSRLKLLAYRLQKLVPVLKQQLWLHQLSTQSDKYKILPLPSGFNQYSLHHSSSSERFDSTSLLTHSQYRQDLYRELSNSSEPVTIYSRGFNLDAKILNLLLHRSTQVYADGFIRNYNYKNPF